MLRQFAIALMVIGPLAAHADLSTVPAGTYVLDETHGYITFTYTHLGFSKPRVGFNAFETELELDSANPENSAVTVTIDATSIDSRVAVFNEHLNSDDWFDTGSFPKITFRTTGIEALDEQRFSVTGDLTIKDITKPVTLEATINKAAQHPLRDVPAIGISASAELLRCDWGLDGYVPAVSDEVTLSVEVELLKAP